MSTLDEVLRAKYRELMNPRPAAKASPPERTTDQIEARTAALRKKLENLDRSQWKSVITEINTRKRK